MAVVRRSHREETARRVGAALGLGLAGVAYVWTMLRRNDALQPERVRDPNGTPLPERRLRYRDGEEISLIDAGTGPPIVWVPGADGVKETFRFQLPGFAGRYRVIAADLRKRFAPEDTFDRFTEDLVELTDRLATGPVALLGQSLGSAIAARFAERYPDRVTALGLFNPVARVTYEHLGWNGAALVPLAIATTRYLPTSLGELAARAWCRANVWIYDDSAGCRNLVHYALWTGPRTVRGSVSSRRVDLLKGLDLRPGLPSIGAPTVVVKGLKDSYCPPEWALEICRLIPRCRYVTVPDGGHCCHISRPGAFNRLLATWLEEVLPSGKTAARESRE